MAICRETPASLRETDGESRIDMRALVGREGTWRRVAPTPGSLNSLYHPQDLGLEGTLLTDILYRNVAFLNLVDPISHDLLMNLARDLQCPKMVRPAGKDLRLGSAVYRGQESPGPEARSLDPDLACCKALGSSLPLSDASFNVLHWPATGASVSCAFPASKVVCRVYRFLIGNTVQALGLRQEAVWGPCGTQTVLKYTSMDPSL